MKKQTIAVLVLFLVAACSSTDKKLSKRADKIHKSILTVDTHCDTPLNLIGDGFELGVRNEHGCVDFPRMTEGGLDAEFFAIFIGQSARNEEARNKAHGKALEIFDTIFHNIDRNSHIAEIALTPDDAIRLKKENKKAVFIGMENGYPIGLELERISHYYNLGARYITLCHSSNNDICDSSTDPTGPEHDGLSPFGEQVVEEMNRQGMMIDVSHISDQAFYDVLEKSRAPVIASHSSCRALCSSPRNLSDDMLQSLKTNGGVIQICILSNYIKTPGPNPELDEKLRELSEKWGNLNKLSKEEKKAYRTERDEVYNKYRKLASVSDVVDHIDHVVQIAGIDHVGIGTDFDGGGGVEGCKSVADMKNITIELLRRGYTRKDIKKIWGENIMRVFREVQSL